MPTGETRPAPQRGFTYLWLLFFVALSAAALAGVGTRWQAAAQRERERELHFRSQAFARAIASYRAQAPAQWPRTVQDLLQDRRGPRTLHHLRQFYPDPYTQQTDWVLVPAPEGPGFMAVRSRVLPAEADTAPSAPRT
ncbi:type II secretion system protein [Roseateles sp. BYS180W]|uniref:Type II secretion system protein n=1 Tax=Roseateles rivi TaxID=3299028 RepID=A0ABW7FX51_9BURK